MTIQPEPKQEQTDRPVTAAVYGDEIAINGKRYEWCHCGPGDGVHSHVRLSIGDPFTDEFEVYDVVQFEAGYFECSCADFIYRSGPTGFLCKHIAGCRKCGLLECQPAFSEKEKVELDNWHDDGWRVAGKDGNHYENVFTGEREGV